MADRYKILGQDNLTPADGLTELYSVPVAAAVTVGGAEVAPKVTSVLVQALVTSIIVCNTDATAGSFDIQLEAAAATSSDTYLFKVNSLSKNNTKVLSLGLTLSPGDKIRGNCTTGDCDFTVMGIEITSGGGPDV